jgi:hypothetical protein
MGSIIKTEIISVEQLWNYQSVNVSSKTPSIYLLDWALCFGTVALATAGLLRRREQTAFTARFTLLIRRRCWKGSCRHQHYLEKPFWTFYSGSPKSCASKTWSNNGPRCSRCRSRCPFYNNSGTLPYWLAMLDGEFDPSWVCWPSVRDSSYPWRRAYATNNSSGRALCSSAITARLTSWTASSAFGFTWVTQSSLA